MKKNIVFQTLWPEISIIFKNTLFLHMYSSRWFSYKLHLCIWEQNLEYIYFLKKIIKIQNFYYLVFRSYFDYLTDLPNYLYDYALLLVLKVHMVLHAAQDRRPKLNLQDVSFLKFLCYHFIIMVIKFLINQRLQIKRSTSKKFQDGYLWHPSMAAKQISYPFIYHLNTCRSMPT